MAAKMLSVFTALLFTGAMAQASVMGSWTGDVNFSTSAGDTGTYHIQQDLSQTNDVFTYSQIADDFNWISQDFTVVNGELMVDGAVLGTISEDGFSFANLEVDTGLFYDASMTVNSDGTASFKDNLHDSTYSEMLDGVLTPVVAPAPPVTPVP